MLSKLLKISTVSGRFYYNKVQYVRPILAVRYTDDFNQKRYYKNFGHKSEKEPLFSKLWYTFLFLALGLPLINYEWYDLINSRLRIAEFTVYVLGLEKNCFRE